MRENSMKMTYDKEKLVNYRSQRNAQLQITKKIQCKSDLTKKITIQSHVTWNIRPPPIIIELSNVYIHGNGLPPTMLLSPYRSPVMRGDMSI